MLEGEKKIGIDDHIEGIKKEIQLYEHYLDQVNQTSASNNTVFRGGFFPFTKSTLKNGIEAHTIRISTLNKIQANKPITNEEFVLLMKMPAFQQDDEIAQYPHIIPSLSMPLN